MNITQLTFNVNGNDKLIREIIRVSLDNGFSISKNLQVKLDDNKLSDVGSISIYDDGSFRELSWHSFYSKVGSINVKTILEFKKIAGIKTVVQNHQTVDAGNGEVIVVTKENIIIRGIEYPLSVIDAINKAVKELNE